MITIEPAQRARSERERHDQYPAASSQALIGEIMTKIDVVSPVGGEAIAQKGVSPRLADLNGKTVAEVWNGVFKGEQTFPIIRAFLKERFPKINIIPYTEFPHIYGGDNLTEQKAYAKQMAVLIRESGCDGVISGNGACGTCTPAAVRPAVAIEQAGIPVVVVTATGFSTLARLTAKAGGVEGIRLAEYPGTLGNAPPAMIKEKIQTVLMDQIVAGLTGNSTDAKATANSAWDQHKIVFSGTLEEINKHFSDNEWTEGLPIVPPTTARIEEFLRYTDYAPDKQIATLPSANLVATPWNIAANAVMAGCRPQDLPVVIAAIEAFADEKASLNNIGSSSGSIPFIIINGPIVKELGYAAAGQLICRSPNTAVGRAVGLVIRNIAGFRPGNSYMGTFGYPLAFTLAEDDTLNPWEPFHVGQGFDKQASTVTVGVTTNWGSQPEASSGLDNQSGAEIALKLLLREVTRKARVFDFATIGPKAEHVMITLLLSPSVAKCLAEAGYSKRSIAEYLFKNVKMPLGDFEWLTRYTYPASLTVPQKVEVGLLPKEFLGPTDKMVPILADPDIVHIVVCGDPNRNRLMVLEGGHSEPTTKAIRQHYKA
jgi:hypothetical protein